MNTCQRQVDEIPKYMSDWHINTTCVCACLWQSHSFCHPGNLSVPLRCYVAALAFKHTHKQGVYFRDEKVSLETGVSHYDKSLQNSIRVFLNSSKFTSSLNAFHLWEMVKKTYQLRKHSQTYQICTTVCKRASSTHIGLMRATSST